MLGLALALGASGCKGKPDRSSAAETALAEQRADAPPTVTVGSGPLLDIVAPQDVWAYGGVDAMAALAQKLGGALGMPPLPSGAGAMAGALVGKPIAKKLGLTSPSGLDLARPLRFAVVDPRGGEKAILVVGITSRDALVQTLPAGRRENEQQNAYAYGEGSPTYVNFVGDYAVFSRRPGTFTGLREFLGRLAGATLPAQVAVAVPLKNAFASLGPELAMALEALKRELPAQAALGGAAPGTAAKGAALATETLTWLAGAAKEVDHALLTASFDDGALVTLELAPKPGTALETTFKSLAGRPHKLLAKLPADAPLFLSVAVDPQKGGDLTKRLYELVADMEGDGSPRAAEFASAAMRYWNASTGEVAFAAHALPDGPGLAFSGIMGLRDAAEARRAKADLDKIRDDPRWQEAAAATGAKTKRHPDAFKLGGVSFDTTEVEVDRDKLGGLTPGASDMLGALMHQAAGLGEDAAYYAMGAEPQKALELLLGPKARGGLDRAPGVARALEHAAPGPFFVGYARVLDLLKAFAPLGGGAVDPGVIPATQNGLALSLGVKDGAVRAVLDLPMEQVVAAIQLYMSRVGSMPMPAPGRAPLGL
ncbi:MAG: hypothetical protein IT373_04350 [Polyangiaceae bacterium]|nr:hypothetical protein [Polyangiaceae bacterium]